MIPISNKEIEIGDNVVLVNDIMYDYVKLLSGEEFTVINIDTNYNKYYLKNNMIEITITSYDKITKKISLRNAKQEYDDEKLQEYFINTIGDNCPYKKIEYDHRDEYFACGLIDSYSCNYCHPSIKCYQYLSSEHKDDPKLIKYLRKNTLKKLI